MRRVNPCRGVGAFRRCNLRKTRVALALLVTGLATGFLVGPWKTKPVIADDDEKKISIRDDCDPNDPTWAPTGGCTLEEGDVNRAEFNAESDLTSGPLAASVIGHLAWRNDPSYLKIEEGDTVKVRNKGGRGHTFTEVENFGGGRVPPLNKGLVPVEKCQSAATAPVLPPGASMEVTGLSVGNHRFQCCLHPWMRVIVKVKPQEEDDEEDH